MQKYLPHGLANIVQMQTIPGGYSSGIYMQKQQAAAIGSIK